MASRAQASRMARLAQSSDASIRQLFGMLYLERVKQNQLRFSPLPSGDLEYLAQVALHKVPEPIPSALRRRLNNRAVQQRKAAADHVTDLMQAGQWQRVQHKASKDFVWRDALFQLPAKAWCFVSRAIVHALPVDDRLRAMYGGERPCVRCGKPLTLFHVLNHCEKRLDSFTWRHNNVLAVLFNAIRPYLADYNLLCDVDGHTPTVPEAVQATMHRPDISGVHREQRKTLWVELTIPFETTLEDAHWRKVDRAKDFKRQLALDNWEFDYCCVEVTARGLVASSMDYLFEILKMPKAARREATSEMAEVAMLSSYVIFCLADEKDDPPFNRIIPRCWRERMLAKGTDGGCSGVQSAAEYGRISEFVEVGVQTGGGSCGADIPDQGLMHSNGGMDGRNVVWSPCI